MMTLTYTETQAKVNENYKLRQENILLREFNSKGWYTSLIAKNNIIINANNHIMANYVTIVN